MKPSKRNVKIQNLKPDYSLNVREENNYDLLSMLEQIVVKGRILKTFAVEDMGEAGLVPLQGNRRVRAAQMGQEDPKLIEGILDRLAGEEKDPVKRKALRDSIPARTKEVLDSFDAVEVIMYKGLSDEERLSMIMDHDEKRISKAEVVNCVWRLDRQFKSASEIGILMMHSLAAYSGNERKLSQVPTEPKARQAFLSRWFKGTLSDTILKANRLGSYVRQQFYLGEKAKDGLLREGEVVEVKLPRERLALLSQAKSAEEMAWTEEAGSPEFNKLLQQFKDEDAGKADKEKASRPSVRDMKDRVGMFQSGLAKGLLLYACGETGDHIQALPGLDEQCYRDQLALKKLSEHWEKLPEQLKAFATQVLHASPQKLEEYLKGICS